MSITDQFRSIDAATRTVAARKAAAERADRIRTAVAACDPDDMDAHIAGTDWDEAPIFGACNETCHIFPEGA